MNIKTSGGRAALPIAPNIVWSKHAIGQYVGFRKTSPEHGTWWARVRDSGTGKQHYKALGDFAAHQQAKRYDVALAAALVWFREADAGVVPNKKTVKAICEAHIKKLRAADGDIKADAEEKRFERLVYADKIATIEVTKLRKADLEAWRQRVSALPAKVSRSKEKSETRPRSPATVNRDSVPLRAALNRALDDGLVVSDLAWRVALRPIKNADKARGIYLDRAERTLLLSKAGAEIKPYLQALTLLPLRPGALASLKVADFNPRLRSLRVGIDKAGAERRISLPKATADFLAEQAKGKTPGAALFARADGSHWNKDAWKWPIKDAVLAAELPAAASAYSLRHSTITDLVVSGLDLLTIAQISGTSVQMIQAHYGHLRQEHAALALAKLAL